MNTSTQRVVFRRDAEQLQLHIRVRTQRCFQCQRLTSNAAVAIARCRAVIQTYAHALTPAFFREGRRV